MCIYWGFNSKGQVGGKFSLNATLVSNRHRSISLSRHQFKRHDDHYLPIYSRTFRPILYPEGIIKVNTIHLTGQLKIKPIMIWQSQSFPRYADLK